MYSLSDGCSFFALDLGSDVGLADAGLFNPRPAFGLGFFFSSAAFLLRTGSAFDLLSGRSACSALGFLSDLSVASAFGSSFGRSAGSALSRLSCSPAFLLCLFLLLLFSLSLDLLLGQFLEPLGLFASFFKASACAYARLLFLFLLETARILSGLAFAAHGVSCSRTLPVRSPFLSSFFSFLRPQRFASVYWGFPLAAAQPFLLFPLGPFVSLFFSCGSFSGSFFLLGFFDPPYLRVGVPFPTFSEVATGYGPLLGTTPSATLSLGPSAASVEPPSSAASRPSGSAGPLSAPPSGAPPSVSVGPLAPTIWARELYENLCSVSATLALQG